jgi:hypothetical protein
MNFVYCENDQFSEGDMDRSCSKYVQEMRNTYQVVRRWKDNFNRRSARWPMGWMLSCKLPSCPPDFSNSHITE